jgi:hypothetical protein
MSRTGWHGWAIGAGVLMALAPALWAETPRCGGHGGVAGCDQASLRVICMDGSLDMRFPCTTNASARKAAARTKKPKRPKVKELKFKPDTTHGQIRSPGEPVPVSTIEQSQRDLSR